MNSIDEDFKDKSSQNFYVKHIFSFDLLLSFDFDFIRYLKLMFWILIYILFFIILLFFVFIFDHELIYLTYNLNSSLYIEFHIIN